MATARAVPLKLIPTSKCAATTTGELFITVQKLVSVQPRARHKRLRTVGTLVRPLTRVLTHVHHIVLATCELVIARFAREPFFGLVGERVGSQGCSVRQLAVTDGAGVAAICGSVHSLMGRAGGFRAERLRTQLAGPRRLVDVDQHVFDAVTEGTESFATDLPGHDGDVLVKVFGFSFSWLVGCDGDRGWLLPGAGPRNARKCAQK